MPGTPKLSDLVGICSLCWLMTAMCVLEMPAAWAREMGDG